MNIINKLKNLLFGKKEEKKEKITIYQSEEFRDEIEEIHSVWDYIKIGENSQAAHLSTVLGFDEWISMDEILRRIKEIFLIEYKNDRSLYPYIKTLVDIGLVETTNIGGKKKWRKRDILIKLKGKKEKEEEREKEKATV